MTMVPTAKSDVPSKVNFEARDMVEERIGCGRLVSYVVFMARLPTICYTRVKRVLETGIEKLQSFS